MDLSSHFFLFFFLDILVGISFRLLNPTAVAKFQGEPFSRGVKYAEGGENFAAPFTSETVRDRPTFITEHYRKS